MSESTDEHCEINVPGYSLVSRIGAGGYGEVWLAHAPGGLNKAVKVIFGFHNEKRAARELHSLEKIKEVRHPFLLSLERIEVVDGRLIIVTELADASLKDRFDSCVQEGLPGIPRDELLRYLRDTADALDYLNRHHSLQHLDVKPENLLLLAGHVKVADFGLVKEIQDTQASLVGGMTPLYSAPEVFQGTPSNFSDQYSLAILYQEMLTGKLPFTGVTSAELTLQHMHDEPDMSALPMDDRYVLARALSKDPQSRFASCSEMVQALLSAGSSLEATATDASFDTSVQPVVQRQPVATPQTPRHPGSVTQVFEDDLIAEVSQSMLFDVPQPMEPTVSELAPQDLPCEGFEPTPTLFIGIGGAAGKVLQQLKQRTVNRYGKSEQVPAMQMLLLDTDPKALLQTTHCEEAGLESDETLTLALRRPQEYRERASHLLQWLSRRWLYNIPKSLRTEGLRPLGRLAFVDHARRTLQRIRLSLAKAVDAQSVATSTEQTGLKFNGEKVRVYVVASISGGTGSGMSLDIGYAVQTVLQKLGIERASTSGIFLHSTGRDSRHSDLAKVNAYSWLTEYNHFHGPDGFYPGDEASGLPAQPPGKPAFDNTYLVHLGDGLTEAQLAEQAVSVAEYLYLDSWTSAQSFFEASRQEAEPSDRQQASLRTFGLHKEASTPRNAIEQVADQLCHRIVRGWSGTKGESGSMASLQSGLQANGADTSPVSETNQLVCGAAQAVAKLQLNIEGIAAGARSIVEGQFGSDIETLFTKLLAIMPETEQPASIHEMLQIVDGLFAVPDDADAKTGAYVLGRPLEAIVSPLGMKLVADLQRWVLCRLDDRQERLPGTQDAAEWFAKHFERVEADSRRLAQGLQQKITETAQKLRATAEGTEPNQAVSYSADEVIAEALAYFRLRLDLSALQATGHMTRMFQAELKTLREMIVEFGRHLRNLAEQLGNELSAGSQPLSASDVANTEQFTSLLLTRLPDLELVVDRQLQEEFIDQQGGLFQTVMSSGKVVAELMAVLKAAAVKQVEHWARELSPASNDMGDSLAISEHTDAVKPTLLKFGGVTRQLVVVPQEAMNSEEAAQMRKSWGETTSLLAGNEGDLVLCCEAGQLPLTSIAVDLIESRRDYADFAKRVHARNDIPWLSLLTPVPVCQSANESEFATQVL